MKRERILIEKVKKGDTAEWIAKFQWRADFERENAWHTTRLEKGKYPIDALMALLTDRIAGEK